MAKLRMIRDGVTEDELLALAKEVGFEVKNDEDLKKIFRLSADLGFWPGLDLPKGVAITSEPKPAHYQRVDWGCLGGYPEEAEPKMTKKGPTMVYPSQKTIDKHKTKALSEELDRLTQLADALEATTPIEPVEDLDNWLDTIK